MNRSIKAKLALGLTLLLILPITSSVSLNVVAAPKETQLTAAINHPKSPKTAEELHAYYTKLGASYLTKDDCYLAVQLYENDYQLAIDDNQLARALGISKEALQAARKEHAKDLETFVKGEAKFSNNQLEPDIYRIIVWDTDVLYNKALFSRLDELSLIAEKEPEKVEQCLAVSNKLQAHYANLDYNYHLTFVNEADAKKLAAYVKEMDAIIAKSEFIQKLRQELPYELEVKPVKAGDKKLYVKPNPLARLLQITINDPQAEAAKTAQNSGQFISLARQADNTWLNVMEQVTVPLDKDAYLGIDIKPLVDQATIELSNQLRFVKIATKTLVVGGEANVLPSVTATLSATMNTASEGSEENKSASATTFTPQTTDTNSPAANAPVKMWITIVIGVVCFGGAAIAMYFNSRKSASKKSNMQGEQAGSLSSSTEEKNDIK